MKLSIAVCDDDKMQIDRAMACLQAYCQSHTELEADVQAFCDGRALLESAGAREGFDIYILDILMPGLDGIQLGRRLRELSRRKRSGEIIYLTCSNEYAADSYDVRAFFYLLKPVADAQLFEVLDAAIKKLQRRRLDFILVTTRSGARRIYLDDVIYIERVGRVMRYNCIDAAVDSLTLRTTFREAIANVLLDPRFYLCGASYALNFQHVVGVEGQKALLDNGEDLLLPRTAAVAFKCAWGDYWLGEA